MHCVVCGNDFCWLCMLSNENHTQIKCKIVFFFNKILPILLVISYTLYYFEVYGAIWNGMKWFFINIIILNLYMALIIHLLNILKEFNQIFKAERRSYHDVPIEVYKVYKETDYLYTQKKKQAIQFVLNVLLQVGVLFLF